MIFYPQISSQKKVTMVHNQQKQKQGPSKFSAFSFNKGLT